MPAERPSVQYSVDFERVETLERRVLNEEDADCWAAVYTDVLRAPGSRAELRRWQGPCFAEAVDCRGGFYVLPVGFGKTILTRYLGLVLEGVERVLLIVPANLRDKTRADFRSYIGVWRTDKPPPAIMSREELALEKNAKFLETFQPQAIVIDESDEFANWEASAVQRIDRYLYPPAPAKPLTREQCAVFCLSGTPTRNTIMAYWHLLRWTHRERMPMPLKRSEALKWAAALDQQKTASDTGRMDPGPLGPSRKAALHWYRKRLQETPGVIIIDGDSAVKKDGTPIPLRIHTRLARECPLLDAAFLKFGLDQQNPDGVPCVAPLERWRLEGFLGCGLFPRYKKPGPPKEWREERAKRGRAFAALCRDTIRNSRHWRNPADTEKQVRLRHRDNPIVLEWDEMAEDPYAKEVVWISQETLQTAINYLAEAPTPAIIWTGCVEFGKELARVLGLSYFGRDGKDQYKNDLDAISRRPEWRARSFICSWHANKKGFNLQPWLRHGVFNPPTSAKWLEQLMGRAHRADVDESGVTFTMFATSGGTLDAIDAAVAEAGFAKQSVGPTQKILRAEFKRERVEPRRTERNKYRWARA